MMCMNGPDRSLIFRTLIEVLFYLLLTTYFLNSIKSLLKWPQFGVRVKGLTTLILDAMSICDMHEWRYNVIVFRYAALLLGLHCLSA